MIQTVSSPPLRGATARRRQALQPARGLALTCESHSVDCSPGKTPTCGASDHRAGSYRGSPRVRNQSGTQRARQTLGRPSAFSGVADATLSPVVRVLRTVCHPSPTGAASRCLPLLLSPLRPAAANLRSPAVVLSAGPGPQSPAGRSRPCRKGATGAVTANLQRRPGKTPSCCFGNVPGTGIDRRKLSTQAGRWQARGCRTAHVRPPRWLPTGTPLPPRDDHLPQSMDPDVQVRDKAAEDQRGCRGVIAPVRGQEQLVRPRACIQRGGHRDPPAGPRSWLPAPRPGGPGPGRFAAVSPMSAKHGSLTGPSGTQRARLPSPCELPAVGSLRFVLASRAFASVSIGTVVAAAVAALWCCTSASWRLSA